MKPPEEPEDDALRFTRKSPLAPTRKLCPKCLNPLQVGSELGGWLVSLAIVPPDYFCSKCGYRGMVYVESDVARPGAPQKD